MTHLDSLIGDGVHLYRDRRSVADAYAYIMARWTAKLPKTWNDYPNVARFFAHIERDPVVQNVLQSAAKERS